VCILKEQQILTALTVTDIAEEGKGIARANEMVVFIEKAIPVMW
jgi:23S rRNA (uracil1939-C5)-methyltransferase